MPQSPKVMKPNDTTISGNPIPQNHSVHGVAETVRQQVPVVDSPDWQATIEEVVKSVVSINFYRPLSFDTDTRSSSQATGFIVDAERGIILTNRHVIGPGPFSGHCVLYNNEECHIWPIYRDPVHDFGFLQFDPHAVRYMTPTALKLQPGSAKVGVEIRVVGNDAGEKLSILSGVISRLDRNAPKYDKGYNDFNTNYIQASAAAKGGSSGSPVVDLTGHAIALQAGSSSGATTDFFLPLDRPLRALRCLQENAAITRGNIQTQWVLKTYDDCHRLGLTSNWESAMRDVYPDNNNMLVAERVLPEGPGHKMIEEGDILIKVNGQFLVSFTKLDDILDSSVGGKIRLLIQREGQDVEVTLDVEDLHVITPDRFVTVAGASFHNLSYQQAHSRAIACQGLYVCHASGSFELGSTYSGWLINTIDNKHTPDLDTFIEVMGGIPDKARVVVSYWHISNLHKLYTKVIRIDRHWRKDMELHIRNDKTGLWDSRTVGKPLPALPPVKQSASFPQFCGLAQFAVNRVIHSFVKVSCYMPEKIDGYPYERRNSFGIVVDAQKGLILAPRPTVPHDLCDITIEIASSAEVDGRVIFLHPFANFTIIQYDPASVDAPIQTAILSELEVTLGQGIFVGFDERDHVVVTMAAVTSAESVIIPADTSPRYRATNLDIIFVETGLSTQCSSGALISDDGVIQALWLPYMGEDETAYYLGLPTIKVNPIIKQIRTGVNPELRALHIEPYPISMNDCRNMGVPEEWIKKVVQAHPSRHQLFKVEKVYSAPHAGGMVGERLEEADIILTINDEIITEASRFTHDREWLDVVVVRQGQEVKLRIPTIATKDLETSKVVIFCGMTLQKPHHAVQQQISKLHSNVYVSSRFIGSPAEQNGLSPTCFITHVNGTSTPDLDSFVTEVSKIPDNTYFRLRVVTFYNIPRVVTMKTDNHYFGILQYVNGPTGWEIVRNGCREHE